MSHERRNRNPLFLERARELCRVQNQWESVLWELLRGAKLKGYKFRRQHPVGHYIVDFYCARAALVIELDGITHRGREVQDGVRQAWLESQGLLVLRCSNHEFSSGVEQFVELIWKTCCQRTGQTGSSNRKRP